MRRKSVRYGLSQPLLEWGDSVIAFMAYIMPGCRQPTRNLQWPLWNSPTLLVPLAEAYYGVENIALSSYNYERALSRSGSRVLATWRPRLASPWPRRYKWPWANAFPIRETNPSVALSLLSRPQKGQKTDCRDILEKPARGSRFQLWHTYNEQAIDRSTIYFLFRRRLTFR